MSNTYTAPDDYVCHRPKTAAFQANRVIRQPHASAVHPIANYTCFRLQQLPLWTAIPDPFFSVLGSMVEESVIPGLWDPAGIIDWRKFIDICRKNDGFHYRAITSVYLAKENNVMFLLMGLH